MDCLTLAHNKWFGCAVIFFLANTNAESSISASDVKFCHGVDYNETIGQQFIDCAETLQVVLNACDSEYQTKLEFAVANELYETCSQPQCVYYSMELAFRWNANSLCYSEKNNTGVEDQCWESEYNDFYTSGDLLNTLATFCYAEPASSLIPTSYPSAYPTQWCDGDEYTDDIGTTFVSCGTWYNYVTVLKVEACDKDYQDALYFGIANQLYETCVIPFCVWANLDYAFLWDAEKECYAEVYNDANAECWSGINSIYYANGKLEEKLDSICFDTVTPTTMPTETPSSPPTEDPTGSPTNPPTTFPSPTPTASPTMHPTQTPTKVPSQTPTATPTSTPTNTPTNAPTNFPTAVPSQIPTNYPTTFPSHRPTVYPTTGSPTVHPTTGSPTVHPTEKPSVKPTMPWVPRTSLDSSVFVSADVSCITKQQIAGTIAPLGRVVNVSRQEIGIESYSKLSNDMAGHEGDGFWIQWLVVLTSMERTEDLLELIQAGDITKELTQEFETEFKNSNCSMIVENITAWSLKGPSAMTLKSDNLWVALTCGLIIIAFCILCAVMCCRWYKSDKGSRASDSPPYEEYQDTSAGSNNSDKVGNTVNTITAGGAGTIAPNIKKSKRVSFISGAHTGDEGTNGKVATTTRGSEV